MPKSEKRLQQVQGTKNVLCKEHYARGEFKRVGCMIGLSPMTCKSCGAGEGDNRMCPPKEAANPFMGVCSACAAPKQVQTEFENKQKKNKQKKGPFSTASA